MEKHHNYSDYIRLFSDDSGEIYISYHAIRHTLLHYLGNKPTEKMWFKKNATPQEKIEISNDNNQLVIKINVLISKTADVSNNIYLLQDKIRTAIVENTNLDPWIINVAVIDCYHEK